MSRILPFKPHLPIVTIMFLFLQIVACKTDSAPVHTPEKNPTITFTRPNDMAVGDEDQELIAYSTNTITPISYVLSDTTIAVITANKIHAIKAGTLTITASQVAGNDFPAALPVTQVITIRPVGTSTSFNQVYLSTKGNDKTALRGSPSHPFLTIAAAIAALDSTKQGIVNIPATATGVFASPSKYQMHSNITFIGEKKPVYDDVDNPTKLINGAILLRTLNCSRQVAKGIPLSNIKLYNIGIDNGPALLISDPDIINSGDCLVFGQDAKYLVDANSTSDYYGGPWDSEGGFQKLQTSLPAKTGMEVHNCITLGPTRDCAFHSAIFESCANIVVNGLEAYNCLHGIVFKSSGGIVNNIKTRNNSGEGLNLKSNDYAYCYGLKITNVYIGNSPIGLLFHYANGPNILRDCDVSGITIDNCTQSLQVNGDKIMNNSVSGITYLNSSPKMSSKPGVTVY